MNKNLKEETSERTLNDVNEVKDLLVKLFQNPEIGGLQGTEEDGYIDCKNIGKAFKSMGYVLPTGHKWAFTFDRFPTLFESKIVPDGKGTKRVAKLLTPIEDGDSDEQKALKAAYANTPVLAAGWHDFDRFAEEVAKIGLSVTKEELRMLVKKYDTKVNFYKGVYRWASPNGEVEIASAFRANQLQEKSANPVSPIGGSSIIPSKNKAGKKSAFNKLMAFATFPSRDKESKKSGFAQAIDSLKSKVLAEHWYFGEDESDKTPILNNYIVMTFERLLEEDKAHADDPNWRKKILVSGNVCVFNTGLVDNLFEPVYAAFNKNSNPNANREWVFWAFINSTDPYRQILTRSFGSELPLPAHYYDNTAELVFNIKLKVDLSGCWDHIIKNCSRMPIEFLQDNGPRDFDYDSPKTAAFYKKLADAILSDTRAYNRIKNRFEDALDYAIKRVRWNFKTAIPIYYPSLKRISLLLPLALREDESKPDVALVLEETEGQDGRMKAYIGHTIYDLKMAYKNARLITRPDSDWLTAQSVPTSSNDVNIDEEDEAEDLND